MPAKKKSAAHDAEKGELLRQAELRKLAEEQERLHKLETEARQRLEGEWRRALDDECQRQMEIRRAITDWELKLTFEVREQQLRDDLERKDCECRELRAKLNGLQLSVETMMQDRESALRRVAMLSNELELAQMKSVEAEAAFDEKIRETYARLREVESLRDESVDAYSGLKMECERLKRGNEEIQAKLDAVQAAQATDLSAIDAQLLQVHPQSTDAETALLLKVLNEEVEKHRETVRLLQSELERKGRDDEKGSVLISLLNSQLESSRDECKRLHELSTDRRRELEAVQSLLDGEREKTKTLYRDLDKAYAEATVERRQFTLEIGVHKAQVGELTNTLERVNAELSELKEQFDAHRAKAAEREQYDFQVNVSLKGEVEQLKKDLNKMVEEMRIAGDDAYTKKALLRAEIESLKIRLQKLQENAEKNEREAFETIAVLRATTERLQEEKVTMVRTTEEDTRKLRDNLTSLAAARDALQALFDKLKAQKEEVEKDLFEKLLRMTANHDRLHEDLQQARTAYAAREKEFVENAIFLNAEKETLKSTVEELTEKLARRTQEHAQHVQSITEELTALKARAEKQLKAHQSAQRSETERASNAEAEVQALKRQVAELELLLATRRRERDEMEQAMKCEIRELRLELNAAKRTIERFECALGDTSYKSLCEANDRMRRDLEQQREKVAVLNDTIASMKVESTVMESYKEKMLADKNERYSRRVQQLEALRQIMNPLFFELRSIVERHGLVGVLRRDLDAFDDHVRRSRLATGHEKWHNAPASPLEKAAATSNANCRASTFENGYPTLPAVDPQRAFQSDDAERCRFFPRKPASAVLQPQEQQPSSIMNELPSIV
ncbi:hypothetical protein TraAM80_02646 [Trypanosoma rangeli]|uniref:Uncharacterized protein n=1 Tax=Trypanosoma rangeli TaxID=5698 RepID=A0A422NT20_TRYRA|nr:uncharacterized protein TraAM80_02646 [Trypanosoma rangeli]RNF08620.1 hypothetical protein TraAM80_02646 [Trypanosoma rangeli]|eukprot:RNF08620.1 hypothetical protein TraAM80_02646 [Trypanosoma rangeli]